MFNDGNNYISRWVGLGQYIYNFFVCFSLIDFTRLTCDSFSLFFIFVFFSIKKNGFTFRVETMDRTVRIRRCEPLRLLVRDPSDRLMRNPFDWLCRVEVAAVVGKTTIGWRI